MKKSFLLISFLFFLSSSLIGQNKECSVIGKDVTLRGFKLGMSEEEAKHRYPKIEIFQKEGKSVSTAIIGTGYTSLEQVFSESEREGLSSVELTFLNKALARINVAYNGLTEWNSVNEFTNASAEQLKLPLSSQWKKTDTISLRLNCKDFYIVSRVEPKLGKYELQKPILFFSINDYAQKLKAIEESNMEKQKDHFKP